MKYNKTNLEKAKKILDEGEYTCVLCKDDIIYTSKERGIRPVLMWLEAGIDMKNFSAADKIIGKAAALLFVLAGVCEVYAPLMSDGAISVFSENCIKFENIKTVKTIVNRQGDGQCPMESTVAEISDPNVALVALKRKSLEIRKLAQSQSNN